MVGLTQGMEVYGVPEYVVVGGRVCVDECDLKAVHGFGKFIECPTYPQYVYEAIEDREKHVQGVARSEADVRKLAEEVAAFTKAREAAKAAMAAAATTNHNNHVQTNGNSHYEAELPRPRSIVCTPTLPNSAIATPSVKGPRLEGQRNLQDSTFSISGKPLFPAR